MSGRYVSFLITVAGSVLIGLALPAFTRYRSQPGTEPQEHPQPASSPAAGARR
jgi:hypothetical protein